MVKLQLVHQLKDIIAEYSSNKPSTDESEDSTSTKLIHNAYVYDVNGKRIKKYEGKSKLTMLKLILTVL